MSVCTFAQYQVDLGFTVIDGSRSKNFRLLKQRTNGTTDTSFTTYTCEVSGMGIYLYPKLDYKQIGSHSITIGFPIMLGTCDTDKLKPMYDINMSVDINGGRANLANVGDEKWMGYYIGAGIGYISSSNPQYSAKQNTAVQDQTASIIRSHVEATSYFSTRNIGLMFHAGVVVPFAFRKSSNTDMGLRLLYKPGFGKQLNYWGLCLFTTFKGEDTDDFEINGCSF